jgi:hypothetical protein
MRGKKRALRVPPCTDHSARKARPSDENALSASMRELILSFGITAAAQTRNMAADTRKQQGTDRPDAAPALHGRLCWRLNGFS